MKLARNVIRRILIMTVLVSFAQFSLISNICHASIADSKMIMSKFNESASRETDQKKIRRMLENKILRKRLKSYGVSDEEIYSKIESMSDEQVHQLASLSDRIPAGGDAGVAALIVLVTIAVAIILSLVLVVLSRKG
jgi:hypothetical protein